MKPDKNTVLLWNSCIDQRNHFLDVKVNEDGKFSFSTSNIGWHETKFYSTLRDYQFKLQYVDWHRLYERTQFYLMQPLKVHRFRELVFGSFEQEFDWLFVIFDQQSQSYHAIGINKVKIVSIQSIELDVLKPSCEVSSEFLSTHHSCEDSVENDRVSMSEEKNLISDSHGMSKRN